MFKLTSNDLPTIAQPIAQQSSTPVMRLWDGESRAIAPISTVNYLSQYANSVGFQPIVFHADDPLATGIYSTYTLPLPIYEVFVEGFTKTDDPRKATPNCYWLTDRTINISRDSDGLQITLDAVLSAVAIATATTNRYQIDTTAWGDFTVPTNIFVDGIELTQSGSHAAGTFEVVSGSINIYTSAPLPHGDTVVHINQTVPCTPKSVIATYATSEFAHACDLAGRTYFRALNYLLPEVYEFISDDETVVSLFAPLDLYAGLAIAPSVYVDSAIAKDVTTVEF